MPKFSILSGSAVLNVLLIALNLYADTEVSGAVDGEWTRQGSPYIVTGQIVIDDQDELVINSGVQVLFATDVPFFIYGRLIAVGTMQDSIRFAPRQEGQTWEGLRMIAPDSLTLLSFCVLTNGRSPERERTLDSTSAGGNLFITGGGPGWVRIEHCRISRGRARSMGGGAMVWRASPEFYACLFSSNDCDSLGGALGVRFGSPLIRECRFIGNGSNWGGGAMYLTEGANAIVDNSEFLNNTCSRGQGGTGGAVSIWNGARPTLSHCVFAENLGTAGGAAYIRGENTAPLFEWCDFISNAARDVDIVGGAIYFRGQPRLEIRYCRFIGNVADRGGAIYAKEPPQCNIHHNLFVANGSRLGGGALGTSTDIGERPLEIKNCTFYRNSFTGAEPVANTAAVRGESRMLITSSIIQDEAPRFEQNARITVTYTHIRGGFNGEGNSAEDPGLYEDNPVWYMLKGTSTCRNTGNPNLPQDPDGTANDRGWMFFPVNYREGFEDEILSAEVTTRTRAQVEFRFRNITGVPIYVCPYDNWRDPVREAMVDVSGITGDSEIHGAAGLSDGIYLSGSNNGRAGNRIYRLDRDFNLRGQFVQPGDRGGIGFQDLAGDGGSILYGGDDAHIVEFTSDGEIGEVYDKPNSLNRVTNLAADFRFAEGDADFYMAGRNTFIVRANSDMWELNRLQVPDTVRALAAKGNARALYMITEPAADKHVLNLVLPEDGKTIPLYTLNAPESSRIGGIEVTHDWTSGKGTLIGIWERSGEPGDMLFVENLYVAWLALKPEERLLLPGDSTTWTMTILGDLMPEGVYDDVFYLTLNGDGENGEINARMINRLDDAPLKEAASPGAFVLADIYPNPFNASATVSFNVDRSGWTTLQLYDARGGLVRSLQQGWLYPGRYNFGLFGNGLSSGIYYLGLRQYDRAIVKPLILIR